MPALLLVFEYPSLNGGERSILATLDQVRAGGFEIHAAAPPSGPLAARLRELDVTVWPIVYETPDGRRPLSQLRADLEKIAAEIRPALLHANSLSTSRLTGPVAAALGLPSIGHLRDIMRVSAAARADIGRHTRLLAVSEATRSYHIDAGLPPDKVLTVYNGVDVQEFCPRQPTKYLHQELGLRSTAQLVGSVGQICLRKGFDVFLKAAGIVAKRRRDVHFLIVGRRYSQKDESRRYEEMLIETASQGSLAGRVHFLGQRADMPRILPELNILVHASRQEPLGRVLLEAGANGTAIIATDVGGTQEILGADDESARLVAPDDVDALAETLEDLLANPDKQRLLGTRARQRVVGRFDLDLAASNLIRHYHQVLALGGDCSEVPDAGISG